MANSGIRLDFFPVTLTTWAEWANEHPDTTILTLYTDIYKPQFYFPEFDARSVYYNYSNTQTRHFHISNRRP